MPTSRRFETMQLDKYTSAIIPVKGLNGTIPSTLKNLEMAEADTQNMYSNKGALQPCSGLIQYLSAGQPLSIINHITHFKADAGTVYTMLLGPTSVYRASTVNNTWTVSNGYTEYSIVEAGDTGNQLSGWWLYGINTTNSNAYVLYWKLYASGGSNYVELYKNSDGAAGNKVATGNRIGNGVITLSEANSSGISGSVTVAYSADDTDLASNTLTLTNTLSYTNIWQTIPHFNQFYATNGVGRLKHWTGSMFVDVDGLRGTDNYRTDSCDITAVKTIASVKSMLLLGNLTVGGIAMSRRILYSLPGPLIMDGSDFDTLDRYIDVGLAGDEIVRIMPFGKDAIVYCKYSAALLRWAPNIGNGTFYDDSTVKGVGLVAPNAVVDIQQDAHIFMGQANIYVYQGGRTVVAIGDPIKDELYSILNQSAINNIHAVFDVGTNTVTFWIPTITEYPDTGFIYNITDQTWFKRSLSCTASANVLTATTYLIDDLTELISSYTNTIDQWGSSSQLPVAITANANGYIMSETSGVYSINSAAQSFVYESPDIVAIESEDSYNLSRNDYLDHYKCWTSFGFEAKGSRVELLVSLDKGTTWLQLPYGSSNVIELTPDYSYYVVQFNLSSRQIRFKLQSINADDYFSIRYYRVGGSVQGTL